MENASQILVHGLKGACVSDNSVVSPDVNLLNFEYEEIEFDINNLPNLLNSRPREIEDIGNHPVAGFW